MKKIFLLCFFAFSTLQVQADTDTVDAAIGGAIGGAAGAAIGNEVAGRDGAILGGALGAGIGAAVTTNDADNEQRAHRSYTPRAVHCPPGQAKKGRC